MERTQNIFNPTPNLSQESLSETETLLKDIRKLTLWAYPKIQKNVRSWSSEYQHFANAIIFYSNTVCIAANTPSQDNLKNIKSLSSNLLSQVDQFKVLETTQSDVKKRIETICEIAGEILKLNFHQIDQSNFRQILSFTKELLTIVKQDASKNAMRIPFTPPVRNEIPKIETPQRKSEPKEKPLRNIPVERKPQSPDLLNDLLDIEQFLPIEISTTQNQRRLEAIVNPLGNTSVKGKSKSNVSLEDFHEISASQFLSEMSVDKSIQELFPISNAPLNTGNTTYRLNSFKNCISLAETLKLAAQTAPVEAEKQIRSLFSDLQSLYGVDISDLDNTKTHSQFWDLCLGKLQALAITLHGCEFFPMSVTNPQSLLNSPVDTNQDSLQRVQSLKNKTPPGDDPVKKKPKSNTLEEM